MHNPAGRRAIAVLLLFCILVQTIPAQSAPAESEDNSPIPYQKDEFSPFLQDLRRAEIVAVGILPFAYLVSSLSFDLGRYIYLSISEPETAADYAPLFFAPPQKPPNTNDENTAILAMSIGISLALAIVDRIIDSRGDSEE